MTTTRFTYTIMARPKVKEADALLDLVNKNMKEFGVEETVHYNAEIGTFSFNLEDSDKQKENIKKVLEVTKTELEKTHLSDVTFKLKGKEVV